MLNSKTTINILLAVSVLLLTICLFLNVVTEYYQSYTCAITFTASVYCKANGQTVKVALTCGDDASSFCHVVRGLKWLDILSITFSLLAGLQINFEERIESENRKMFKVGLASLAFICALLIPILLITLEPKYHIDVFPILIEFTAAIISGAALNCTLKDSSHQQALLS